MKYILLLLLIINGFNLFSKDDKINALIHSIGNQKDNIKKVNDLIELATFYEDNNKKVSLKYTNEALQLATKLNFQKGIGLAYLNLGKIDQDFNKKSSFKYYSQALKVFKETNDKENEVITLFQFADLSYEEGNYQKSIDYLNLIINDAKKIKNLTILAQTQNLIGACNGVLTNNPEALSHFLEAYKIYSYLKDDMHLAEINYNLGALYQFLENKDKAKFHFSELLTIAKKINNIQDISLSYYSIGNLLLEEGDYKNALINTSYALKLALKDTVSNNDLVYIEAIYNDLAEIHFKSKNYKQAEKNYLILLNLSKKNDYPLNIAIAYLGLGEIDMSNKSFSKAKINFEKSLEMFMKIKANDKISLCYKNLYELANKKGDYKKAIELYKTFILYKDIVYNEEKKSKMVQVQMQFEFNKKSISDSIKNSQIQKIKNAEIALSSSNLKKEKNQFWFVLLGLILVVFTLIIVINRFHITKKQKVIIEVQNAKILESINYSKKIQDALLPNIGHVKNNLQNFLLFSEPKDIVSGDFYWYKRSNDFSIISCADCTGHGVPGAFMSTIGSLIMDKTIVDETLLPSEILSNLNDEIIRLLKQQSGGEIQDGMDLSICIINHTTNTIAFSGARNGITIIKNGEAKRYKADLMPVGGNYMKKGKPIDRNFNTQSIEIDPQDWIYMYTDGFFEQIGGNENIPMNYKQYEELLIRISNQDNEFNKLNTLQSELTNWRGTNDRTDDILIIGFQII